MSGKKTISNSTPAIGAIQIQQSTYGVVIPIVWGRTRIAGNLIWYGDFQAVPHTTTTQTGGKGGGGTATSNTTYTYTASVAMALCEGPVVDVLTTWRGKNIFTGQTYNGAAAQETDTTTYPSTGGTYTVQNTSGWRNISVEAQVQTGYADDFTYNRSGTWVTLVPGTDYTCTNGVYTFPSASQYGGAPIRITYTFASGNTGTSCLSEIGLELHSGTPGQAPWSYLTSKHPDQALGYSGIAYVAGANYTLDGGASVENHAFEVQTGFSLNSSVPDADPSRILQDALTNPVYGVRFGLEKLASLTAYSNACLAQGIVLSPALTEQTSAAAFLDSLAQLTNVGMVWSGGLLKLIPYTDAALSGNGVSFNPNTTPIFDLTDDDFQPVDDEGPIKVTRGAVSDSFNSVKLEYFDRSNDYNIAIMEQADQADIQENGARPMSTITAHWITDANVAKVVATLILQRSLFIRNTYEFTLGWTKVALEPMDLVTITDASLGLNKQPVRILSIEEDENGLLSVVAEDFPKGSASATLYPTGTGDGYIPNFNESPGSVGDQVIFEGPAALAQNQSGLEVWLAAGGASPTYGGCEVWVSLTGSNYQRMAVINGNSRFGTTTTALPAAAPGTTTSDALGVHLEAGGQLLSGTVDDMNALTTLCYLDGEYFAYENSQLTGTSAYTIGNPMLRGAYLSRSNNDHASGLPFVRCDDALAKMPLTADYIGKTLYIKLLAFNRFGGAVQSLADVNGFTYTVTGWQANLPPIAPPNLGMEAPFVAGTAKFKWDRVGNAASYNVQIWTTGATPTMVRQVNAGDALRFDYSAADMKADGGPWRSITIKVQGINANGAAGAFASYTATNPQVGALANPKIASQNSAVQFACDRPADSDFSGIQVWISATSGFTPSKSTLVYDGPDVTATITRLADGTQLSLGSTYYVRAAGYDTLGQDGETLTAELPITIANTSGVQSATIYLYQWAQSQPPIPTGTSTYTWSTGANSNYTPAAGANPPDAWALVAGSNPGTPLLKLYVATVQLTATVGTSTSTVGYSSATVAAWSQNGATGTSGVQSATATVYQWAATIPAAPAGSATWTWSSSSFGAAPSGWSLTSGNSPSPGMTLWAAKVQITDSASNSTTAFNWTGASVSAQGYAGSAGSSYVTAYCASSTGAATGAPAATTGQTSLPAANSGGITGTWSSTVPTLTAGQYLYQSDGIYNPANNTVTWSTPYWSSLKVGSLSAVSVNTGALTISGTVSDAAGNWSVDSGGNMVGKSITIKDSSGNILLSSGGQGSIPTSINNAATTANWSSVSNRPQDTTNLINKTNFEDGSLGGWYASYGGAISVVAVTGQSFTKAIQVTDRDNYENYPFPVKEGETLYYEAWLDASTCGYGVCAGAAVQDAAGNFTGWYPSASSIVKGAGWTYVTGSFTVPPKSVRAFGWIQIGGSQQATDRGTARATMIRVSRYQSGANLTTNTNQLTDGAGLGSTATWSGVSGSGKPQDNATVGATIGTNLNGQFNSSNITTYIAGASIGLALINTASITSLSALSANIGLLTNRTGGSGAGVDRTQDGDKIYDTSNALKVKIGNLS